LAEKEDVYWLNIVDLQKEEMESEESLYERDQQQKQLTALILTNGSDKRAVRVRKLSWQLARPRHEPSLFACQRLRAFL